jgi:hypothetical protein
MRNAFTRLLEEDSCIQTGKITVSGKRVVEEIPKKIIRKR